QAGLRTIEISGCLDAIADVQRQHPQLELGHALRRLRELMCVPAALEKTLRQVVACRRTLAAAEQAAGTPFTDIFAAERAIRQARAALSGALDDLVATAERPTSQERG